MKIIIGIITVLLLGGITLFLFQKPKAPEVRIVEQLKIEDLKTGTGAEAVNGKSIEVHYEGTHTNGQVFDSSRPRNQSFSFVLGGGSVIRGWDEGLKGMKVGGLRKLTIPPDLAYGVGGSPPVIGPNETLIFTVELLSVK